MHSPQVGPQMMYLKTLLGKQVHTSHLVPQPPAYRNGTETLICHLVDRVPTLSCQRKRILSRHFSLLDFHLQCLILGSISILSRSSPGITCHRSETHLPSMRNSSRLRGTHLSSDNSETKPLPTFICLCFTLNRFSPHQ